ncbi:MAG: hypothetical protein U9R42_06415 [Bacteroidota bacterium]|nr:hypothetical protein [Bacteroidota bacterium]
MKIFSFNIKILLLIFFTLSVVKTNAQQDYRLKVLLKLQSLENLNIKGIKIEINQRNGNSNEIVYSTDTLDNYISLELDKEYTIHFSHPKYYSKSIEIDTRVPKKKKTQNFMFEIEVAFDKNCENNPRFAKIIDVAIGRLDYNRNKNNFYYDNRYTFKMGEKYETLKKLRCKIAKEIEKNKRKTEKLAKRNADIAKMKELQAEQEKLLAQQSLIINPEKKVVSKSSKKKPKEKVATVKKQPKKIVFDKNQKEIHIFPKHGWPSELANSILEENYKPKTIGTYTYDLRKGRKDFFVSDADELRKAFPDEFNKAFDNWDYIVKTNTNYKNK